MSRTIGWVLIIAASVTPSARLLGQTSEPRNAAALSTVELYEDNPVYETAIAAGVN